MHVHDRYYDTAVKNKYYSKSFNIKGERKIEMSDNLSFGFGGDYNYTEGDFKLHGSWGSSADGNTWITKDCSLMLDIKSTMTQ